MWQLPIHNYSTLLWSFVPLGMGNQLATFEMISDGISRSDPKWVFEFKSLFELFVGLLMGLSLAFLTSKVFSSILWSSRFMAISFQRLISWSSALWSLILKDWPPFFIFALALSLVAQSQFLIFVLALSLMALPQLLILFLALSLVAWDFRGSHSMVCPRSLSY